MPETTTDPTAAEIAREYFDRYPGLLHILRLGHATEETLGHAATLVCAALAAAPAEQSTDEVRSWSLPAPPPDGVAVVHIPEMYELQGGPELHRSDDDRELWWGPDGSLWNWSQMLGEGTVVEGAAPCRRCGHAPDQHVGEDVGCLDEQCPCAVYQPPALKPQAAVSSDDAHTETVTEWRAFGSPPADAWDLTGQGYVGESQVAAQTSALVLRRCGYADVRVESRTVTTSRRESEWRAVGEEGSK